MVPYQINSDFWPLTRHMILLILSQDGRSLEHLAQWGKRPWYSYPMSCLHLSNEFTDLSDVTQSQALVWSPVEISCCQYYTQVMELISWRRALLKYPSTNVELFFNAEYVLHCGSSKFKGDYLTPLLRSLPRGVSRSIRRQKSGFQAFFQFFFSVWFDLFVNVQVDNEDAHAARVGTLRPQSGGGQPQIFPTSGLGLIRQCQLRCGSRQFKFGEPGYLWLRRWADNWWPSGKKLDVDISDTPTWMFSLPWLGGVLPFCAQLANCPAPSCKAGYTSAV